MKMNEELLEHVTDVTQEAFQLCKSISKSLSGTSVVQCYAITKVLHDYFDALMDDESRKHILTVALVSTIEEMMKDHTSVSETIPEDEA